MIFHLSYYAFIFWFFSLPFLLIYFSINFSLFNLSPLLSFSRFSICSRLSWLYSCLITSSMSNKLFGVEFFTTKSNIGMSFIYPFCISSIISTCISCRSTTFYDFSKIDFNNLFFSSVYQFTVVSLSYIIFSTNLLVFDPIFLDNFNKNWFPIRWRRPLIRILVFITLSLIY